MKVSVSNLDNGKVIASHSVASKAHAKPSFGSNARATKELAKALTTETKWFPRGLEWLKLHDGEILNTIVTGIGTAFVAPIFIAFNPFSKEDKETKAYSAWRQPISAVLAVATQIIINDKYNKHLDNVASTGRFDRANLKAKPTAGYLRRIIMLEHPEYTKQQLAEAIEERQIAARWQAIKDARDEHAGRVLAVEEYVDDEAKKVAKKELEEEFKEQLKGMKEKEKTKFFESKLSERAKLVAETQVQESAKVKFKASQLATDAKNKGLSFAELLNNVDEQLKSFSGSADEKALLEQAFEKLKGYKKYSNMKYLGFTQEQVLQSIKIKKMVFAQISKAESVLASYRRWTGIVISLATLPVSCGLLNWVYPRLMEKIMPRKAKQVKNSQPADSFAKKVSPERKEVIK